MPSPRQKVRRIDLRGKVSPLTIVEIARVVKRMRPGETIVALITDVATLEDLRRWSRRTGNRVGEPREAGGHWEVDVTKV